MQRQAVFVDKDGTLVIDVPYNADPAKVRLREGAAESLAALAAAGYALVVVSNQSGIERGYITRAQFAEVAAELSRQLRAAAGVRLLEIAICPHAPGADGRPRCPCRKPAPGMLQRAARMHDIDLSRSWMVGDILDDVEAGRRARCRTVLLESGGETEWRQSPLRVPDARCAHWPEVVAFILQAEAAHG
jgi:D-glycero-D-manno-heptose 1,7-bisphosphate phosphatase